MVDKFKQVLTRIINEKKSITLFAVVKMDDLTDKWTVLLCAPWSTDETRKEDFTYVRKIILETFTNRDELATIARIGIFPRESLIIQSLLHYKSDTVIKNEKINGNLIHEAHILASSSAAAST